MTIHDTVTTERRESWLRTVRTRAFVVHYVQMLIAMGVGMAVLGTPLMMVAHDASTEVAALLMATSMTVGMVAWMAVKRHSLASMVDMALAMYLAFVVLFPLLWLDLLSPGGLMLAGHVLMLPFMAVAMLRRGH